MKSKILLAVALLLAISTTSVWAADSSEKTNQKTGSYTNEDVWAAYEGFNNTLLDPDKYIYKTTSAYEQAAVTWQMVVLLSPPALQNAA